MQSEVQGASATVDDHLRTLIQLMKRGGRISVTDIPNDPTFLSSHFGGPTAQAMAEKLEAALSAAEPVAWVYEDELPGNYPYDAMFPYSKVDGVRLFPIFGPLQPAPSVAVKALEWDEFSTELKRHFQSNTILGQYQIAYLGEFECWQLYSPQKSSTWKENFSRHKSSDEAKAGAQADYESRIRSALA